MRTVPELVSGNHIAAPYAYRSVAVVRAVSPAVSQYEAAAAILHTLVFQIAREEHQAKARQLERMIKHCSSCSYLHSRKLVTQDHVVIHAAL
jgi:hypothetical protein